MPQLYVLVPVEFNSTAPRCDCVAHRFGSAADHPERVRRYPSDMTDAEWAAVRPLLPVPGWLRGRGGQPEAYCHRAILDAIRYVEYGVAYVTMRRATGVLRERGLIVTVHGRGTFVTEPSPTESTEGA